MIKRNNFKVVTWIPNFTPNRFILCSYVVYFRAGKPPTGLHLDVMKGDKLIQKLMLDEKKCYLFGRNPQMNDFCIDHASCSRVHSAFVYHKHLNRAFLVDLGSSKYNFTPNFLKILFLVQQSVGKIGGTYLSYHHTCLMRAKCSHHITCMHSTSLIFVIETKGLKLLWTTHKHCCTKEVFSLL